MPIFFVVNLACQSKKFCCSFIQSFYTVSTFNRDIYVLTIKKIVQYKYGNYIKSSGLYAENSGTRRRPVQWRGPEKVVGHEWKTAHE